LKSDHYAGGDLQSKFGAAGESEIAAVRDLRIVVGESDGSKSTGGEDGDPDKSITEVRPKQRGDNDGDDDQETAHRRRTRFFLMCLRPFFADVLADLEITKPADDQRAYDERGEQSGEAGKGSAKSDVPKNTEGCDVVLQLDE
jgi:hypothetical protein